MILISSYISNDHAIRKLLEANSIACINLPDDHHNSISKSEFLKSAALIYEISLEGHTITRIANIIQSSNLFPEKCVVLYFENDFKESFSSHQIKSIRGILHILNKNGVTVLNHLDEVELYFNKLLT